MITNTHSKETDKRKAILSTLWIFLLVNYLYCDLLGLMDPGLLNQFLTGNIDGIEVSQGFLLAASVLMEIPMAMILLSKVLNYRVNRLANIVAAVFMTVVQISSFFVGSGPTVYYIFFSIVEVSTTLFIVWYAWTWRSLQEIPETSKSLPASTGAHA